MAHEQDPLQRSASDNPDSMVEDDCSGTTSIFFDGKIPDAISAIKSEQKILIVYVAGDDEDSCKLDKATWPDSKVHDTVSKHFVALRLQHGSSDATHFAAMFPYQQIPTITIVNHNGMLLKRHGGFINSEDFLQILNELVALQNPAEVKDNPQSESSFSLQNPSFEDSKTSEQECGSSANSIPSSVRQLIPNSVSSETSAQSTAPQPIPTSTSNVVSSTRPLPSSDPKVSEETETLSQRGLPQGLSSSSNVALQYPPILDKSKNSIHDDTVASAVSKEKSVQSTEKDNVQNLLISEKTLSMDNERSREKKEATDSLLLQVKLTNGKSIRGNFKHGDNLTTVKKFVDENRTDGYGSYSLAVIYPRKVFTQEDMEKTLKELNFEDRATLVLVANSPQISQEASLSSQEQTNSRTVDTSDNAGIWKFLSYLNPLSYFKGSNDSNSDGSGSSNWQYEPDTGFIQRIRANSETEDSRRQRNKEDENGRKNLPGKSWGGNIHTLKRDDDDKLMRGNAFWNGNSTQFGGDDSKKS